MASEETDIKKFYLQLSTQHDKTKKLNDRIKTTIMFIKQNMRDIPNDSAVSYQHISESEIGCRLMQNV